MWRWTAKTLAPWLSRPERQMSEDLASPGPWYAPLIPRSARLSSVATWRFQGRRGRTASDKTAARVNRDDGLGFRLTLG